MSGSDDQNDENLATVSIGRGEIGPLRVEVNLPPGASPARTAPSAEPDEEEGVDTVFIPLTSGGGGDSGRGGSTINALLRYADGRLTSISGAPIDPGASATQRVVDLPYASSEVLLRLGPYDVVGTIGKGGMGVVYRAWSIRLARWCAIKVMKAGEYATEIELIRFQNEAMLAARLSHPFIVPVFDAGESGEQFYFVMEFIDGTSFNTLIQSTTDADLRAGVEAIARVADALHYAHERGIVHRDIKPDNILLTKTGEPRVTDFGIAFSVGDPGDAEARGVVGTPYYMPPEQAAGETAAIGPRSDVYALGATLYHLLTGQPPFKGNNAFEVLLKVTRDEPEAPHIAAKRNKNRKIPLDLETICLKCMEKEVARRYDSAAALAADLRAFLEDRPIAARPIGNPERLKKLIRRNRAAFVGAVILLSTLMLMTVAFGSIVAFNIYITSESLRELDRQAGLNQANTLERAIRVNMLQGRADLARQLVGKLREDKDLNRIVVVRTDRTIAYTDLTTKRKVEKRLKDDQVVAWIERDFPELLPSVQEVRAKAFTNIEANEMPSEERFEVDLNAWSTLVTEKKAITMDQEIDGEPNLVVLKPIENSEQCQTCHGRVDDGAYGDTNSVRAVLVVYRSRKDVEAQIRKNELATLGVGLVTTGLFIGLLFAFARLFGIRLNPRRFGA